MERESKTISVGKTNNQESLSVVNYIIEIVKREYSVVKNNPVDCFLAGKIIDDNYSKCSALRFSLSLAQEEEKKIIAESLVYFLNWVKRKMRKLFVSTNPENSFEQIQQNFWLFQYLDRNYALVVARLVSIFNPESQESANINSLLFEVYDLCLDIMLDYYTQLSYSEESEDSDGLAEEAIMREQVLFDDFFFRYYLQIKNYADERNTFLSGCAQIFGERCGRERLRCEFLPYLRTKLGAFAAGTKEEIPMIVGEKLRYEIVGIAMGKHSLIRVGIDIAIRARAYEVFGYLCSVINEERTGSEIEDKFLSDLTKIEQTICSGISSPNNNEKERTLIQRLRAFLDYLSHEIMVLQQGNVSFPRLHNKITETISSLDLCYRSPELVQQETRKLVANGDEEECQSVLEAAPNPKRSTKDCLREIERKMREAAQARRPRVIESDKPRMSARAWRRKQQRKREAEWLARRQQQEAQKKNRKKNSNRKPQKINVQKSSITVAEARKIRRQERRRQRRQERIINVAKFVVDYSERKRQATLDVKRTELENNSEEIMSSISLSISSHEHDDPQTFENAALVSTPKDVPTPTPAATPEPSEIVTKGSGVTEEDRTIKNIRLLIEQGIYIPGIIGYWFSLATIKHEVDNAPELRNYYQRFILENLKVGNIESFGWHTNRDEVQIFDKEVGGCRIEVLGKLFAYFGIEEQSLRQDVQEAINNIRSKLQTMDMPYRAGAPPSSVQQNNYNPRIFHQPAVLPLPGGILLPLEPGQLVSPQQQNTAVYPGFIRIDGTGQ